MIHYFVPMKTPFLILCTLLTLAAKTQTSEKFYDYKWKLTTNPAKARFYSIIEKKDSLWQRSDYYVYEKKLQMKGTYKDSAAKIKHGEFTSYYPDGYLQSQGSYINNKANGLWVDYYANGSMKDSSNYILGIKRGVSLSWHYNGFISDSTVTNADGSGVAVQWFDNGTVSSAGRLAAGGKLNGKWQYFHKNGNPSSFEIYDNGQLVSKEYFDEKGVKAIDTASKDRDVDFPGGMEAWQKYLQKHVYWPPNSRFSTDGEAVVLISWAIDEDGRIVDAFVALPLHPEFDKIALSAIKRSPRWQPAISHNRKVKSYRTQPITFAQVSN